MDSPTLFALFNYLKGRTGAVPFSEICAAWPSWSRNKIRSRCNQLIHQGYIARSKEDDTYQFVAVA